MKASLVHYNGQTFLPPEMGKPREDQLQGSPLDQLAEIACRVCYDSFGTGRSSVDLHKHIQEVGHLSVYEHCYMQITTDRLPFNISSPPGFFFFVTGESDFGYIFKALFNARHILEESKHPAFLEEQTLISCLEEIYTGQMPLSSIDGTILPGIINIQDEFITLYIECSRACSHELVRHGDYTAISQRSTRYVDEEDAVYEEHPLSFIDSKQHHLRWQGLTKELYLQEFNDVMCTLRDEGLDIPTARKQARGAARMYLPHALQTKLIFTANKEQWYHMLRMRGHLAADAEIRSLFVDHILPILSNLDSYFHNISVLNHPVLGNHLELQPKPRIY